MNSDTDGNMSDERGEDRDRQRVERLVDDLLADVPPGAVPAVTFLREQFDRGLAWVHFPEGAGGLGLSPKLHKVVSDRLIAAGAPNALAENFIGINICAPAVAVWGTEEQRAQYLRPLFTGEEIWCQLFSEPGAGSDFAGLAAQAVPDGDEWIVNGQKVWTTLAHVARRGLLVVRTDPHVPKHAGLTAFVVDMHAPGVEVRPLRQMTGEAEFNEVYFTDARIPHSSMLGGLGDGWRVALTMLMNERTSIGGVLPGRSSGAIGDLVSRWRTMPADRRSAATRDRIVALWVRAETLRLTSIRENQARKMGGPGPEGSILKLAAAELSKDVWEAAVDVMGAEGMLFTSYEMTRPDRPMSWDNPQKSFLRARANSIEGGTSEVMRNIIGERVLGLPGDVRVDRDVPWSQVPRS